MFRKSLLVGFCVVVGVLFNVFSIFSITSFGYCSRPEHLETNKKNTQNFHNCGTQTKQATSEFQKTSLLK